MRNRNTPRKISSSRLNAPVVSAMGKLFVAVFLIVIFEGALRKWVTPSLTTPLVLLRDGLSLYGVFWAISRGKMALMPKVTQILALWTFCVVAWGMLQVMVNQGSLLIFVIGLRFWLLYLWFAYAAAVSLTEFDFKYIKKVLMGTLLVIMPLVVVQFFSPPGSFINRQLDGDEENVFRLAGDIVRTSGTFTFTAGQSIFLGILGPIVLATITLANRLFASKIFPMLIIGAYFVAVFLSGSRMALATFAFQFVCFVLIESIYIAGPLKKINTAVSKPRFQSLHQRMRRGNPFAFRGAGLVGNNVANTESVKIKRSKRSSVLLILGAGILLSILPFILSSAVDATRERFQTASEVEGFSTRMFMTIFGEVTLDSFSFLGYGLGAGTNFAGITTGASFKLGEFDSTRILMEGGVLGVVFIGLKIMAAFVGVKKSLAMSKLSGSSLPLLLWITASIAMFMWQINGQLTINSLGYLLLGLSIASLRLDLGRSTVLKKLT